MSKPCLILMAVWLVGSSTHAEPPIRPGDRIAIIGNTFADQLRIHGYLEVLLLQRSADHPVSIRNLGWAGDMLSARDRPTNFPTETSTLYAHKTDVIIACFGMGESFGGDLGLNDFREDLEALIATHKGKKYNGDSEIRLILIAPIAYENHGGTTPHWERRNQELKSYTRVMSEVAGTAGLSFFDLNQATSELMEDVSAPTMTGNGINLNGYGYWCVSRTLADALLPGPPAWRVNVDVNDSIALASGVSVTDVERDGRGVRFMVEELTWPSLGAPGSGLVHRLAARNQDQLSVKNLAAGSYRLTIDGKPIVIAQAERWAEGVPIVTSPTHEALEKYREAIYSKNMNFIYSWKALNQVHIVGERRRSASGRALPGEIIEFQRIADQKDAELAEGIELKTREWRLVPIQ